MSETYDSIGQYKNGKKSKAAPPEPPKRDFVLEKIALHKILDALEPFHPDVQATIIKTVVVFKNIYIPRE